MKRIAFAALFGIALALLSADRPASGAALPEPTEAFYVNDFADVIDEETERKIAHYGGLLDDATGAQVVIVTVDFTGDVPIEDYAADLFNAWGIGDAEKDNGVLVLMSIGEEDYWAVQGIGLETTLTSGTISLLLNDYLEPDFATGDYDSGAESIYGAFILILGGVWGEDVPRLIPSSDSRIFVADNAGIFSEGTESALNRQGRAFQEASGSGIYIVSVIDTGGRNLRDYTAMKFDSIHAGPKDVMIAIDVARSEYWVLSGAEAEARAPRSELMRLLETDFAKQLSRQEYDHAATIGARLVREYLIDSASRTSDAAAQAQSAGSLNGLTIFLIILVILLLIILVPFLFSRNHRIYRSGETYQNPFSPDYRPPPIDFREQQRASGFGASRWGQWSDEDEGGFTGGGGGGSTQGSSTGGGGSTRGGGAGRSSSPSFLDSLFGTGGSSSDSDSGSGSGGGGFTRGGGAGRSSSSDSSSSRSRDDDYSSGSSSSSRGSSGGSSGGGGSTRGGGAGRNR